MTGLWKQNPNAHFALQYPVVLPDLLEREACTDLHRTRSALTEGLANAASRLTESVGLEASTGATAAESY